MQRLSWIAIGLALAACHCESGPRARKDGLAATPAASADPAESAPGKLDSSAAMRAHMAAHFDAITDVQAAIVQGRLADARDQARWFAAHEMDVPLDWRPYVDEMRFAAARIERARDIAGAGAQIGRLGRACSACHEAQNAHPAFKFVPAPTGDASLALQMARHQWAAARLWEGLVGPNDELWQQGATVMASARLDVMKSAHAKPNAEVVELAERLREQATHAAVITDHDSRATFYGEMMDTCASCHSIVRPSPVVGARQEP